MYPWDYKSVWKMLKTVSWPATERDEELWGWDGWEESRGGGVSWPQAGLVGRLEMMLLPPSSHNIQEMCRLASCSPELLPRLSESAEGFIHIILEKNFLNISYVLGTVSELSQCVSVNYNDRLMAKSCFAFQSFLPLTFFKKKSLHFQNYYYLYMLISTDFF